jgi:two-component system, NtrC family, nitrogen regulation sensor histidine kinase NtrY
VTPRRLRARREHRVAEFPPEESERWLASARRDADPATAGLLAQLEVEYEQYVASREEAVRLFDAGDESAARAIVAERSNQHMARLLVIAERLATLARDQAHAMNAEAARSVRRQSMLVALTALAGVIGSLGVGFLLARSITRPLQRLQLEVELAANRRRVQIRPGADFGSLGEQVSELVRQLEAAIAEERRRALQHEKLSAIGALAAKLAHQLLNPVAGMKTSVQLLARGDGSQEVREVARAVDRELVRVEHLVRRMLTFTRPLSPRFEVCHLSRVLDLAEEVARSELTRTGARLERTTVGKVPPVELDVELMTQAVVNVIVNAAQAAPGQPIAVSTRQTTVDGADRAVVEIRDQGPGIAEAVLPRIFEPFVTTKVEGHGLGLPLSQHIVAGHGGGISARNESDGRGAVFEIWIPLVH